MVNLAKVIQKYIKKARIYDGKNIFNNALVSNKSIVKHIDELQQFKVTKLLFNSKNERVCLSKEDRRKILFLGAYNEKKNENILLVLISEDIKQADRHRLVSTYFPVAEENGYINTVTRITKSQVINNYLDNVLKNNKDKNNPKFTQEFDEILKNAIDEDASDIHIKINGDTAILKMRIDGVLITKSKYNSDHMTQMLSSVYNTLTDRDTKATQFKPYNLQQAAIERTINGSQYRLRYQSFPTFPDGYAVVMRVLSLTPKSVRSLETLGYSANQLEIITKALKKSSGAIIFAGKVGTGKTTTCSTMISEILRNCDFQKKITTIEDPPEYSIKGADQISVRQNHSNDEEEMTKTFNQIISTILRSDIDVIMAGEVRNESTAKMLQKAVESGHKVLTTIHAQSALLIIQRLCGLGFERDILISPGFISLLIYQNLVPTTCQNCALTWDLFFDDNKNNGLQKSLKNVFKKYSLDSKRLIQNIRFRNDIGCNKCRNRGVIGRTVISEIVDPTAILLEAVKANDHNLIYRRWRENGGVTIFEHGLSKMFKGEVCPYLLEEELGVLDQEHELDQINKEIHADIFNEFKEVKCCNL